MSSIQLLILVYLTCLSSSVQVTSALPITSIPLKSSPEHLTWDAAYEPKSPPSQYVVAKKITPKSIFITPNFNNLSVANCGVGWKPDATGQCIQIVTINQADILVSRLQSILSQTTKSNGDDYYDYEASEESPGPLQFDLFSLGVPQSLKGENIHGKVVMPLPPSTTTTTNAPPTTSSTTDLFSSASERFEVTSEEHTSTVLSSTESTTTPYYTTTTTTITTTTTTTRPSTLTSDPDEVLSISQQLFLANHVSTNRTKVDSTDLDAIASAVDQSTTTVNESIGSTVPTEYYESTDFTDLATTRVQPTDEAEDLATLNSSLNEDLKADFLIFDDTDESMLSTTMLSTTDSEQEDTPTTVLFEEEVATETKPPPPSLPPVRSSVVSSTQRQHQNTVIVTPIRSSTISLLPAPTPRPTHSPNDVTKFEESYQPLLKIENDTKHSEQLRVSVMNHETKANNMDRLESNNRFVYHHLESTASDPHTTTEKPAEIDNNTYERHHQLFPLGDPAELKRNRIRFPDPPSAPPSPQPFQPRSEMVRFPGPVSSRQSATLVASTPVTVNHLTTDELDSRKIAPASDPQPAKPTWWLPTGWEVDRTTNSQKPLLLRFWSRMPLIRDPSLSFRNNDRDRNLRHRENSKSPRENFYKEIASQDIYKVFESNKHSRHYNHR